MNLDREIDAAVAWWKEHVGPASKHLTGTPGDKQAAENDVWAMYAKSKLKPLTDEQLDIFEEELRRLLRETAAKMEYGTLFMCCDYGPTGELAEAAELAGFPKSSLYFPAKTNLNIRRGHVEVGHGYGQPFVRLYPPGREGLQPDQIMIEGKAYPVQQRSRNPKLKGRAEEDLLFARESLDDLVWSRRHVESQVPAAMYFLNPVALHFNVKPDALLEAWAFHSGPGADLRLSQILKQLREEAGP